ncbi:MAG: DUF1622 domain-containing protein [Arenicellales bacterium]
MIEILEYLELTSVAISVFAAAVMVVSFAWSALRCTRRFGDRSRKDNFSLFKVELGSGLILGLEILVLADVIETITVTPTFESLAQLAAVIVVRTAVSWTLTLETEGCWPWQVSAQERDNA